MGNQPCLSSLLITPIRDTGSIWDSHLAHTPTQIPVSTTDMQTTYLHHIIASSLAVSQPTTGPILLTRNFVKIFGLDSYHTGNTLKAARKNLAGAKVCGQISVQGIEPQPVSLSPSSLQFKSADSVSYQKGHQQKRLETDHGLIISLYK